MFIRSALNNGLAEVDDDLGKQLVESGQWVVDGGDVPRKARTPRAKVVPAEPAE